MYAAAFSIPNVYHLRDLPLQLAQNCWHKRNLHKIRLKMCQILEERGPWNRFRTPNPLVEVGTDLCLEMCWCTILLRNTVLFWSYSLYRLAYTRSRDGKQGWLDMMRRIYTKIRLSTHTGQPTELTSNARRKTWHVTSYYVSHVLTAFMYFSNI